MSPNIKLIAASAATIISFSAYIPYLRDMVKRKTKPHVFTWLTFFLVTITVAIQQVMGGAGYGTFPTIVAAIINAVILIACV